MRSVLIVYYYECYETKTSVFSRLVRPHVFACVRLCFSRLPMQENREPHASHRCGLIPVCNVLCVIRLSLYENALGQY